MPKINVNKYVPNEYKSAEAMEIANSDALEILRFSSYMEDTVNRMHTYKPQQSELTQRAQAMGKKSKEVSSKFIDKIINTNLLETISTHSDILKRALQKNSTGTQLQNLAIDINKMNNINISSKGRYQSMNHSEIDLAMQRTEDILKNGGAMVDYDLETLGGTNAAGHSQTDFITELAFNYSEVSPVTAPTLSSYIDNDGFKKAMNEYDIEVKQMTEDFAKPLKIPKMSEYSTTKEYQAAYMSYEKRKKVFGNNSLEDVLEKIKKPTISKFTDQKTYGQDFKLWKENKKLVPNEAKSYKTFFGYTEDEANDVKKRLGEIDKRINAGTSTGVDELYVNRLSLLANEGIEFDMPKGAWEVNVTKTGKEGKSSVEKAIAGLEKLREIGKHQENFAKANGTDVVTHRNMITEEFQKLVTTGKSDHFKIDLTDNTSGKKGIITGHNINDFDQSSLAQLTGVNLSHEKGMILDTYQVIRDIENNLGQGAHYPKGYESPNGGKTKLVNGRWVKDVYGKNTQDAILNGIGEVQEGAASHNAYIDTVNHSKSFFTQTMDNNKTLFEHMYKKNEEINQKMGSENFQLADTEGIFLFEGSGTTQNNEDNIFSFSVNGETDEIKFTNGTIVNRNANGKAIIDNNKEYVGKVNSLYKIKQYKVDLNSDMLNEMIKSMSDEEGVYFKKLVGTESLYVQEMQEYVEDSAGNLSADVKNRPISFRVSTNADSLTSEMRRVDKVNKDSSTITGGGSVGKMVDAGDGTFKFEETDNVVGSMSIETEANARDGVSRKIRETKQPYLKHYRNQKVNGVSHATMVADLVTKRNLKGEALQNINAATAGLLGQRELEYQQATDELYNLVGYKYNGESFISQREIGNAKYITNFLDGVGGAIEGLEDAGILNIDDMFNSSKDGTYELSSPKAWKDRKNTARNYASMNVLIDEIQEEILNADPNVDPELASLARDTSMSADKWGTVDILKSDMNKNKTFIPGKRLTAKDYNSINMSSSNSLINSFFKEGFSKIEGADIDGTAGYSSLRKAIKYFENAEGFGRGSLGGMTEDKLNELIKNNGSAKLFGAQMQTALKGFIMEKDKDTGEYLRLAAGIKYRRVDVDLDSDAASKVLKKRYSDKKNVDTLVNNVLDRLSDNQISGEDATDTQIEDKIYKYLMYDEKQLGTDIENFSDEYKNSTLFQHKLAQMDAREKAKEIQKATQAGHMNVTVNNDGIFIHSEDGVQKLNTYKYVNSGGTIQTEIGNSRYNMEMSLDASGVKSKDYNNIKTTQIEEILKVHTTNMKERHYGRDLSATVKKAVKDGKDPIEALARVMGKIDGAIIDSSSLVEYNNFQQMMPNNHRLNIDEIFKILPDIEDDLIAKVMKMNTIDSQINVDENISLIKQATQKMRDAFSDNALRMGKDGGAFQTENKTAYYRSFLPAIIDMMSSMAGGDQDINLAGTDYVVTDPLKLLNNRVKSTVMESEKLSTVKNVAISAYTNFENHQRDPVYQGSNTTNFDMKKANKNIEDMKKKTGYEKTYINTKSKLSLKQIAEYEKSKEGLGSGATLKAVQINNTRIKDVLEDHVTGAVSGNEDNVFYKSLKKKYPMMSEEELKKAAKALSEKSRLTSTYEQEVWINSRVSKEFFDEGNKKVINGRNYMGVSTEELGAVKAEDIIPHFENGKIVYKPGVVAEKRQSLGEFGNKKQEKTARNRGIFKGRYHDKNTGIEIEEDALNVELEKIVKKGKLDTEKVVDRAKAFNELQKIYDFNYTIKDIHDSGGRKVMMDATEKATVFLGRTGLGEIDSTLLDDLEDADLFDDFKLKKGSKLSQAALDEMEERYSRKFGKDKARELMARISDEREAMSDAYMELDILKNTNASMFVSVNKGKHISVSSPLQDIETLVGDTLSDDEYSEFIKKSFNMESITKIDDKILLDSSSEINFKSQKVKDFIGTLSKEKQEKVNFALDHSKRIDINGNLLHGTDDTAENAVGSVVATNVKQIREDEAGITSSSLEMKEIEKKRKYLSRDLKNARANLDADPNNTDLISAVDGLQRQYEDLKIDEKYLKADKGLKFTERMNVNLSKEVWNNQMMRGMKSEAQGSIIKETMYDKAFGHALDSGGSLDVDHNGRPFLDNLLERTRASIKFGHGETSLGDVLKVNSKYDYLAKNLKKNEIGQYSFEKAQVLDSYAQGIEAMKLNKQGISDVDIGRLKKEGWNVVDMNKEALSLDVGGQAETVLNMENNPYTNNTILKVNDEYIAMGRMQDKVFDGSIVKDKQRTMLNGIDHMNAELLDIRSRKDSGSLQEGDLQREDELTKGLSNKMTEFKEAQKYDVTSKSGLAGKANSTRLAMSFSGKGKGMNQAMMDIPSDMDSYLNKAQFMGESLSSLVSNQHYVDAAFIGEEAFEEMGYFDEDRMKSFFKEAKNNDILETAFGSEVMDLDDYDQMRKGMVNILETHGDAAFTTRFPNIQDGSDKMSMVYLNRDLDKNTVMTMNYTGMSAKLDHDGDNFFLAMATGKNRSTDTYLSEMAKGHENKKGGLNREVNAYMTKKAFSMNQFWNDETIAQENKLDMMNRQGANFETIAGKRTFRGSLLERFSPESRGGVEQLVNDLGNFEDQFGGLIDNAMKNGADVAFDEYVQSEDGIDAMTAAGMDIDQFTGKFSDAFYGRVYVDESIAKTSKGSIGVTNVTAFKTKAMSLMNMDTKADDYYYKSDNLMELMYQAEEAVISSKSDVGTLSSSTRAKSWNEPIEEIMSGKGTAQGADSMVGWLEKNVSESAKLDELWTKGVDGYFRDNVRSLMPDLDDADILGELRDGKLGKREEVFRMVARDTVSMIQEIGRNDDAKAVYESMRLGMSNKGVVQALQDPTYMKGTIGEVVAQAVNTMSADGRNEMFREAKLNLSGEDMNVSRNFGNSQPSSASFREGATSIMEGAADMFKASSPKSGLAIGALGLAAGILAAGFIGGRPRPADMQAMEEAQQAYTPMDGPLMLADPNAVRTDGVPGGYIVNINARTNGDQQRAAGAIQQALGKGMGSNVNVTMNIGNDYSNINNRDIEQAVLATLE